MVEGDWNVTGPTIPQARVHHDKAEYHKGEMEKEYRLRDAAYAPIKKLTDDSAALLKGKYRSNPKKLSEWRYEVDDSKPSGPSAKNK